MDRRSALRFAGLGGLAAAGGAGAAGMPVTASAAPLDALAAPPYVPSGRRPRYRRASWSQQFQPGHDWSAGGAGTASANPGDTAVFTRGSQSIRVTTAGSGVQSYVRRTGMDGLDLSARMIRLVFRVADVTHLSRVAFYLGTDGLKNAFGWRLHTHSATAANYVQSGEWVTVNLQWSDVTTASGSYSLSAQGEPSVRSGFTDVSFAVYDDAAGPVTYHLQAIELVPATTTVFPRGAVSVTFDDSHVSVHDLARPVMDPYGIPGTVYNIADAVGTASCLDLGKMRSLQDSSGWEMAGHAYATAAHAAGYAQLSAQQVDDDFRKLREWLVGNGFTSEHFAYPHGVFQKTTDGVPVDLLAGRHFSTARSIAFDTVESFAPAMPYRLKALTGVTDGPGVGGTTLANVIGAGGPLDRCARGGWLILCLHKVVAGTPAASTEISQAGLRQLMTEIQKRGIAVLTVQEAMAYYS
ncbi:polysaccharide deacetylase family protein [Streptomyces sp. NPDC090075]|uniref:polysaccharide deacetylase family protein n=1 Tax=Streptomyces sp. NPDC090075 TaxID=3365937 RepID=UPI00380CC560